MSRGTILLVPHHPTVGAGVIVLATVVVFIVAVVVASVKVMSQRDLQVDPKEVARKRAATAKAEAKATELARDAAGSRKIASFFSKAKPKE